MKTVARIKRYNKWSRQHGYSSRLGVNEISDRLKHEVFRDPKMSKPSVMDLEDFDEIIDSDQEDRRIMMAYSKPFKSKETVIPDIWGKLCAFGFSITVIFINILIFFQIGVCLRIE